MVKRKATLNKRVASRDLKIERVSTKKATQPRQKMNKNVLKSKLMIAVLVILGITAFMSCEKEE